MLKLINSKINSTTKSLAKHCRLIRPMEGAGGQKLYRNFCIEFSSTSNEGRFSFKGKTLLDIRQRIFPSNPNFSVQNPSLRQISMMKKFNKFDEETLSIILAVNIHSESTLEMKKEVAKIAFDFAMKNLGEIKRIKTLINLAKNRNKFNMHLTEDKEQLFYFKLFELIDVNNHTNEFGHLVIEVLEIVIESGKEEHIPKVSKEIISNFENFSMTISIENHTNLMYLMSRRASIGELELSLIELSLQELENVYLFLKFSGVYEMFEVQRSLCLAHQLEIDEEKRERIVDLIKRIEKINGKSLKKFRHPLVENTPYDPIHLYYIFTAHKEVQASNLLQEDTEISIEILNQVFEILVNGKGFKLTDQNISLEFIKDAKKDTEVLDGGFKELVNKSIQKAFSKQFSCVNSINDFFLLCLFMEESEHLACPKLNLQNLKILKFLIDLSLEETTVELNYGSKKVKLSMLRNTVENEIENVKGNGQHVLADLVKLSQ